MFEIGKLFRNEGVDQTHSPEFTSVELYQAYSDYQDLIQLTEELLSGLTADLDLKPVHQERPLDFSAPFNKIEFIPSLESACNQIFPPPDELGSLESLRFLTSLCEKNSIETDKLVTAPRLLDKLVGDYLEETCINPTFITEHPQVMSPLAKWHRTDKGITERFELFVMKKEVCNAYTELNDPAVQRSRFEQQAKDKASGDDEAMYLDENFCTALEYGLPPTGGWGMGIDRLSMFLTDSNNIKEVLFFPAMKPEENKPKEAETES